MTTINRLPAVDTLQPDDLVPIFSNANGDARSASVNNFVDAVKAEIGSGTGSVTSVSVAPANGFSGTIATPTTTPQITMSTTASGVLKGASGALAPATAGTDYSNGTSALATGIVKTTTGTGALSVAVPADFPTLNQNTTGTASNVTGTVVVPNGGTGLTTIPVGSTLVGNGTAAVNAVAPGTVGYVWTSNGASIAPSWQPPPGGGGGGTVTSVSVVSANGFAGTVANASTTPAITMTTSVSGILKGNGTALSAATSGTDYSAGTSALATGLVKSTTGTGALSIAASGTDYGPATSALATGLLKNTTGTGAHTIAVSGTDYSAGTAGLTTGIIKSTTGTGALTIAVAGDFPTLNQNTTGTASNVTGTVVVANGGTGQISLTSKGILFGNGTSAVGITSAGTAGQVLTSNGAGVDPTFQTAAGGSGAMVLLATLTPTVSVNVDSLNSFNSTYDAYWIHGQGITPSAQDSMRIRLANSGTVDTANNYFTGTPESSTAVTSSGSSLNPGVQVLDSGSGGRGSNFELLVLNTNSTGTLKSISGKLVSHSSSTAYTMTGVHVAYIAGSTVSGIRFFWSGGSNFDAVGKIRIYGIKNT